MARQQSLAHGITKFHLRSIGKGILLLLAIGIIGTFASIGARSDSRQAAHHIQMLRHHKLP